MSVLRFVSLVVLAVWEAIGWLALVRPTLLPPPSAVIATLVDLARRGELWDHIEITLLRVLFGFVIGAVPGFRGTEPRLP